LSLTDSANSVFNGAFTCCQHKHMIEDTPIDCDKAFIAQIMETVWTSQLNSLKAKGELQTWRRNLALTHHIFAGCEYSASDVKTGADVEVMLDKYQIPSVTAIVEGNQSCLHVAAYEDNAGLVHTLVAARAHLETVDAKGSPPLYLACRWGAPKAVVALLEALADPNHFFSPKEEGDLASPLMYASIRACNANFDTIVNALLSFKADANLRSQASGFDIFHESYTSLMYAVLSSSPEEDNSVIDSIIVVQQLISARADANMVCTTGEYSGMTAMDMCDHSNRSLIALALK